MVQAPQRQAKTLPALAKLQRLNQWVVWRYEVRKGERTKPPYNPKTGRLASSTDSTTWTSYEDAIKAYERSKGRYEGVGFALQQGSGIVGGDLDGCVGKDGKIAEWAMEIVRKIGTYTEVSPSGTGLRFIAHGSLPASLKKDLSKEIAKLDSIDKKPGFEMYEGGGRYLTITGNHLPGTPTTIEERSSEILEIFNQFKKATKPAKKAVPQSPLSLSDSELINKMFSSKLGSEIQALWYGNSGEDDSRDDYALLCHLAFWTGKDASRMESLFNQSALANRDKWQERADYRQRTIDAAIEGTGDIYSPNHGKSEPSNNYSSTHTEQKSTAQPDGSKEPVTPYEEIEAQVLAAIESDDVTKIYKLTDQIVMLSVQEQASINSVISRNKKKLSGFGQREYNNCLKEAKAKKQERECAAKISKIRERTELRAFIDISDAVTSRDLRSECIRALTQSNNPPTLFVQGNELSHVKHEKYTIEGIDGKEREYSRSYIERHSDISLLNRLIDVADFGVIVDDEGNIKYKLPETRLASLVLEHNEKPYPHIIGTTSVPILRHNGEIVTEQGYDKRSHLWYAPSDDLADLHLPEYPTQEDALKAVEVIDDILHDFCFASKKDRTHTFAALLTTLLRPIVGNVPLCNIDAPMQGTGKSLLCTIIVMIATLGAYANLIAPQSNPKYPAEAEEEWRKSILANLMQGYPIVVIDNLPRGCKFSCAALDSALTKPEFTGRLLGQSKMITVPSRAMWICNGNNISVIGDTARRTYHIRLDAQNSKPWLRNNFRYSNIISTVKERRAEIITALLTIIRAWFVAEKPPAIHGIRMGSFEEWSDTLGGILEFIGLEGFLSDLQGQSEEGQGDDEWIPFIEAWFDQFPNVEHTQKELKAWFSGKIVYPGKQPMNELLPDGFRGILDESETKFNNALQKALKKMNDVCFGQRNIRLEIRYNKSLKQDTWKVYIPEAPTEPEHSGAFRSTCSDNQNSSGAASEADLEGFSGAPELNGVIHVRKNIFFHQNDVSEEKNIFSMYESKDSSGSSGDDLSKSLVEPVRRPSDHQNNILRNAPECSGTSEIYSSMNNTSMPAPPNRPCFICGAQNWQWDELVEKYTCGGCNHG